MCVCVCVCVRACVCLCVCASSGGGVYLEYNCRNKDIIYLMDHQTQYIVMPE